MTRFPLALLLMTAIAAGTAVPGAAPRAAPADSAATARPTRSRFTRTLVIVRHGLYDEADSSTLEGALTPDGREQARITASRLAHFPLHIDVLHSSTMTRARETALIIADSLPGLTPIVSSDLAECTMPTEREDIAAHHTTAELDSCRDRVERAYRALFRPSPDRDSTEVVVCHGNVTRYFVCRALGMDPRGWLRLGTQNCSLTVLRVRADGGVQLLSYGDSGHLPWSLVTSIRPARRDSTRR